MEDMRIENHSLDDIVGRVKQVGYKERFAWDLKEKSWRMYSKETNNALELAYVSDTNEVFTTQTFQKLSENSSAEKQVIENVVTRYENTTRDLAQINESHEHMWAAYGLGGTVVLGILSRSPIGAAIGFGIGAAVEKTVKNMRLNSIEKKLNQYFSEHNIYIGSNALNKMESEIINNK
ncbi:MAG: hypothetical protein ABIB43_03330 [archaeon]